MNNTMAAAFGRLCVETIESTVILILSIRQPPSGGCVLKLIYQIWRLKVVQQPPSGGCVLKQGSVTFNALMELAAAFGRLCVETTKLTINRGNE